MKTLQNEKGFTLVELVLYLVISSIIMLTASQSMVSNLEAYSFVSARQSNLADARYALNRIYQEVLLIDTDDIISIGGTSFQFVDADGTNTSFGLGQVNGVTSLVRGAEALISPVGNLQISYYDQDGNVTALANEVRTIQFTITTLAVDDEGDLTLTTSVTPRKFIYANYQ